MGVGWSSNCVLSRGESAAQGRPGVWAGGSCRPRRDAREGAGARGLGAIARESERAAPGAVRQSCRRTGARRRS